uniref:Charged multivesicular body protein 4b n=2 Tax=Bursaphelenchus xylophilus TaxID=6326 RepID=A0A1I7S301_BURXY
MSVFSNLFSKKKEVTPSTQDALQTLRNTEEMLLKKQEYIENKIEQELKTARQHGTKNKRLALQALRNKKKLEKQQEMNDGMLNRIQHQKETLENAATNAEVLQVLAGSAKALKGAHNNMDVDKVHDLMEDIAEQQEVANEIADAISSNVGTAEFDEDELLAELEALEEEDLDKQLLAAGPAPVADVPLPVAPTDALPKAKGKSKEEDEMAQLQAWADS